MVKINAAKDLTHVIKVKLVDENKEKDVVIDIDHTLSMLSYRLQIDGLL